jgi:hypothetical protein
MLTAIAENRSGCPIVCAEPGRPAIQRPAASVAATNTRILNFALIFNLRRTRVQSVVQQKPAIAVRGWNGAE